MYQRNLTLTLCVSLLTTTQILYGAAQDDTTHKKINLKTPYGLSARQGSRRITMEDASVGIPEFTGDPKKSFFGVYDGHGGAKAASTVAKGTKTIKPLHEIFAECTEESVVDKFKHAFEITENALLKGPDTSGTTAVTAYLDRAANTLTIANLGDSRAVLLQGETLYATVDHKPTTPEEEKRIKEKGGFTSFPHGPEGPGYIGNCYAVSRALGDKREKTGWYKIKGFSAKPEIAQITLTGEPAVLILACDGIWDVIPSDIAALLVAATLNGSSSSACPISAEAKMPQPISNEIKEKEGNCPHAISAAKKLRDYAFQHGSSDNLTALVAIINNSAPFFTGLAQNVTPFPVLSGTIPSDEEKNDTELTLVGTFDDLSL